MERVAVTLDGRPGAGNVGVLMADELGYFRDVGLDVWWGSPNWPSRPAAYVANRIDDLGLVQQPQFALAQEKGLPIVAVGSVMLAPTAVLMWPASSTMRRISDLDGRTIGIPGVTFQEAFLESVLSRAGLTIDDVTLKRVGYGLVPALISGKVDAIFGGTLNIDRVELDERGVDLTIPPIGALGLPPNEELLAIGRADSVAEDPRLAHRFMSAVIRGNAAAMSDPERAAEVIHEANPAVALGTQEAQVLATLPLLSTNGRTNPRQEGKLRAWMREEGMFE
jgi:putative hydroxymethylpyrimidine transport system substrate-binding protein